MSNRAQKAGIGLNVYVIVSLFMRIAMQDVKTGLAKRKEKEKTLERGSFIGYFVFVKTTKLLCTEGPRDVGCRGCREKPA